MECTDPCQVVPVMSLRTREDNLSTFCRRLRKCHRVLCVGIVIAVLYVVGLCLRHIPVTQDCRMVENSSQSGFGIAKKSIFERGESSNVFKKQCVSFNSTGKWFHSVLVADSTTSTNNTRVKQPFPKLIHRTWKTATVPKNWLIGEVTCQLTNLDHQYCHWTDVELDEFIASEYPSFLETFRKYPYPIQRADAARYLILYHFGGIYLDLDITCTNNFRVLMANYSVYDVLVGEAEPTGVVSDFIVARPKSVFMAHVVSGLQEANHYYGLPYLSVMLSTGPWFLSSRYWSFCDNQNNGVSGVYVLPAEVYQHKYIGHRSGNSWQSWDGLLIWMLFKWRYPILVLVFILLFLHYKWCPNRCCLHKYKCRKYPKVCRDTNY